MNPKDIQDAYNTAKKNWPCIAWSLSEYQEHIEMVNSGKTTINYPVDFYLASSAGHRINPAWVVVNSELQPKAIDILKRFPDPEKSSEDLWSETIVRLMADDALYPPMPDGRPHAAIIRYRGLVRLLNYCVTVARRIAVQQFRKKRPKLIGDELLGVLSGGVNPDEYAELTESASKLINAITEALKTLSPEQKFLIVMVYREGMKQKDAGKLIGLSDFATNRRIKSAIKTIKFSIDAVPDCQCLDLVVWRQIWEATWPDISLAD